MAPHRPPVRTGADILTCVVVLFLEGALVLVAAFTLGMRRWAEGYDPRPPGPQPMDWLPVIVFGAITVGVLVLGGLMLRWGWNWSAWGQFFGAGLLLLATLLTAHEEWSRARPAPPAPAVTPSEARCVCRSGGGPCECPGG
ncbi:DUF6234 family protein [Streptomyces sp. CB02261]|uniref:DUF6234 family protein n=1 Tax=Streptomyces sp. CB02261 TaxID=1703940 RepID=UPI000AA02F3A|nr:DUF6234 family protein [Streptomyces sp. CB02261]